MRQDIRTFICHGPHSDPRLTPEQREIVRSEFNRGEWLSASVLASAFIERNTHPEPPLCTRPDCDSGVVRTTDEFGHDWLESCPACRANERWRMRYGY